MFCPLATPEASGSCSSGVIFPQEDETHEGLGSGLRALWPGTSQLLSTHSVVQRDCELWAGTSTWAHPHRAPHPMERAQSQGPPGAGPLGISSVPSARALAARV